MPSIAHHMLVCKII